LFVEILARIAIAENRDRFTTSHLSGSGGALRHPADGNSEIRFSDENHPRATGKMPVLLVFS
jgi:hypothetical protein